MSTVEAGTPRGATDELLDDLDPRPKIEGVATVTNSERSQPLDRPADGTVWSGQDSHERPVGSGGESPVSHAHARLLAYFWEEPDRPDFAVTVLARTGAIRQDTERQLAHDYATLKESGRKSSDPGTSISEWQIGSLLEYVRRYGVRDEVAGWREQLDDGEFVAQTTAFVRARRPGLRDARRAPTTKRGSRGQRQPAKAASEVSAPPAEPEPETKPLYDRLGGEPAIRAAVELFYRKVLDDDRLAHYFEDVNIARLKAHQRAMLTAVTGGEQSEYADNDAALARLRAAHAHLKIGLGDFNAVAGHLVTTLLELGVESELVEELTPTILGLRDVIVTVAEADPFGQAEQTADTTGTQESVFDRIGGADAINAAVDLFYRKVLGDDTLSHHFDNINMARLKAHQRAMLTAVAGGPTAYSGRSMRHAHAHLNITPTEFDTVVEHLVATLQELGVAQSDIDELAAPVLALRSDIVA